MRLDVNSPGCFYIEFTNNNNRYFELRDATGSIAHFRYVSGIPRIKFNMIHTGVYFSNLPFKLLKLGPVEIPTRLPELPPAQRDRWKETVFAYNPELSGTPVRIFTETGLVEYGSAFLTYPPPIRMFLLLHEVGHYFYLDESACDLWAMVNYLRMGYNRSMAYYALSHVLSRSNDNIQRIRNMFNNIQFTQTQKL